MEATTAAGPPKLVRDQRVDLNGEGEYVELGRGAHKQRIYVVPQPIAWLRQQLGVTWVKLIAGATNLPADENDTEAADNAAGDMLGQLGDTLYQVLATFMPGDDDLPGLEQSFPRWRWDGYAGPEAAQDERYERAADGSPTAPQVKQALLVCMRLNEIDLLRHVTKMVDPTLVQLWINSQLRDALMPSLQTSSATSTRATE